MRKVFSALLIISLLTLPVTAGAETKKSVAEKAKLKEKAKDKQEARKDPAFGIKPEPITTTASQLDLDIGGKLKVEATEQEIRQRIDLDSKYAPASRQRGDVSLQPEFYMRENGDMNKNSDLDTAKEFKLNVNVGL